MIRFERLFAWSAGAAFVLSLAACGYVFAITWASPAARGGGWRAVAIDAVLFGVFALHHSVFARESIKAKVARVVPAHLLRSFYVWIASALLVGVLALWRPVGGVVYHVTGWPAVALAAVQLSGIWVTARSVARISALELAGIKPADAGAELQVGGPYRWVRHPIYLGWLLALFGAAHMTADRLAFAAISATYLLVAIPWEERSLRGAFGEPYAHYQRAVRWRVLPYIY
jgi:protein-S-isoprenylcysteine O-methyltransferase Ste14